MQTWRSLLMLADLTEYHRIGGAPRSSLSTLIHSGDAFLLDCKLRELVAPRIAQNRFQNSISLVDHTSLHFFRIHR